MKSELRWEVEGSKKVTPSIRRPILKMRTRGNIFGDVICACPKRPFCHRMADRESDRRRWTVGWGAGCQIPSKLRQPRTHFSSPSSATKIWRPRVHGSNIESALSHSADKCNISLVTRGGVSTHFTLWGMRDTVCFIKLINCHFQYKHCL